MNDDLQKQAWQEVREINKGCIYTGFSCLANLLISFILLGGMVLIALWIIRKLFPHHHS